MNEEVMTEQQAAEEQAEQQPVAVPPVWCTCCGDPIPENHRRIKIEADGKGDLVLCMACLHALTSKAIGGLRTERDRLGI